MVDSTASGCDPEAGLLWVDPTEIDLIFKGKNPREFIRTAAPVMAGDWDVPRETRFHEIDVYRALEARFLSDVPWEKTDFYWRVVATIGRGTPKWGCRSVKAFRLRLARVERLYAEIRNHGYKTQADLGSEYPREEVLVGIRRDGRFLFLDGRHRLSIARLLRLPRIPVHVVTRHQEWESYKACLQKDIMAKGNLPTLKHPDLASLRR